MAAAAALACGAPAMATTIGFETFLPQTLDHGAVLTEGGFDILMVRSPIAEFLDVNGFGGLIANNQDDSTCFLATCPSNATGNYLDIVEDSGVRFSRSGGGSNYFTLDGLRLSFLAPTQVPDGNYGLLQFRGIRADGSNFDSVVSFPGQDGAGNFSFGSAMLDPAVRNQVLTSLTISACLFNENSDCVNPVDQPAFGQAQFALDNVSFAAVPEPGSFLLMGLGLGALALRRRHTAAATPATAAAI